MIAFQGGVEGVQNYDCYHIWRIIRVAVDLILIHLQL